MTRRHHSNGPAYKTTGVTRNHCVAFAVARALAEDQSPEAVGRSFPRAVEVLRTHGSLDHQGSWWGGTLRLAPVLKQHLPEVGFRGLLRESLDHSRVKEVFVEDHFNYGSGGWVSPHYQDRVRDGYPTLAQWARAHPHVDRAIICCTGHMGYVERTADGTLHVFSVGARKRVDSAIVLEARDPLPSFSDLCPDQVQGKDAETSETPRVAPGAGAWVPADLPGFNKGGVKALICAGLRAGASTDEIVGFIRLYFPESGSGSKDVSYYRYLLRKGGEDV